ncbi:hypothetical protein M514_08045, partial [Trichuris suis]
MYTRALLVSLSYAMINISWTWRPPSHGAAMIQLVVTRRLSSSEEGLLLKHRRRWPHKVMDMSAQCHVPKKAKKVSSSNVTHCDTWKDDAMVGCTSFDGNGAQHRRACAYVHSYGLWTHNTMACREVALVTEQWRKKFQPETNHIIILWWRRWALHASVGSRALSDFWASYYVTVLARRVETDELRAPSRVCPRAAAQLEFPFSFKSHHNLPFVIAWHPFDAVDAFWPEIAPLHTTCVYCLCCVLLFDWTHFVCHIAAPIAWPANLL